MQQMTVTELKAYLDAAEKKPLMLDVRESWEYRICRLEDTKLIPMRHIPDALAELDPDRETVVICHHGIRSRQVALYLEHQGFTDVINMQGGVAAWAREIDPEMPTY